MNLTECLILFISILALLSTLYFNFQFRKHNKLSVKPILDTRIEKNENTGLLKVLLRNKGTGPAIIDEILVKHLNNSYKDFKEFIVALNKDAMNKENPIFVESEDVRFLVGVEDEGLSNNEELVLLDTGKINDVNGFYEILKEVFLIVKFQDIYEKKDTRKLKLVKESIL